MEEDIKQCEDLIRILDKTSETGKSKHTDCIRNLIARNKELEIKVKYYEDIQIKNEVNKSFEELYIKLNEVVHCDYISKSKAKEKIENKKEDAERYIFGVDVEEGQAMYKILDELEQELLED